MCACVFRLHAEHSARSLHIHTACMEGWQTLSINYAPRCKRHNALRRRNTERAARPKPHKAPTKNTRNARVTPGASCVASLDAASLRMATDAALHWMCQRVFTLSDARSFSGLTSKMTPLGPMLNFDADVKNTKARHECENRFRRCVSVHDHRRCVIACVSVCFRPMRHAFRFCPRAGG